MSSACNLFFSKLVQIGLYFFLIMYWQWLELQAAIFFLTRNLVFELSEFLPFQIPSTSVTYAHYFQMLLK